MNVKFPNNLNNIYQMEAIIKNFKKISILTEWAIMKVIFEFFSHFIINTYFNNYYRT